MNKILKHYYEGEFNPDSAINQQNAKYIALEKELTEILRRFKSVLSESECETLEEDVFNICGLMQFPVAEEAFIKGVRCGFHIMTESFLED